MHLSLAMGIGIFRSACVSLYPPWSVCIYPEFSIPVKEAGVERIVYECIVNNDGKGMRKLVRIEEARRITETAARENFP